MARILIVEDEQRIASFLSKGLRAEGHASTVVADGRDGLDHQCILRGCFALAKHPVPIHSGDSVCGFRGAVSERDTGIGVLGQVLPRDAKQANQENVRARAPPAAVHSCGEQWIVDLLGGLAIGCGQ